jgi:hypothetical protein
MMFVLVLGWMMPLMAADYRVGDRLPGGAGAGTAGYREIRWEDLMPKGWNPAAAFKGIDLNRMQDGDPRADELLAKARAEWDKAPVEPSMNGKQIRMPGFVVPLERKGDLVSEFLLVPYYGACIHVPPPPANQVVHVIPRKPVKGMLTMGAFWISGTISLHSGDSAAGVYGYRLTAEHIEKYDWDREKKK